MTITLKRRLLIGMILALSGTNLLTHGMEQKPQPWYKKVGSFVHRHRTKINYGLVLGGVAGVAAWQLSGFYTALKDANLQLSYSLTQPKNTGTGDSMPANQAYFVNITPLIIESMKNSTHALIQTIKTTGFALLTAVGNLYGTLYLQTGSHEAAHERISNFFSFSSNKPTLISLEQTYLNALVTAPQEIQDLCKLLNLTKEYRAQQPGSRLVTSDFGGENVGINEMLPLGYILVGPPGCGKTEIAKAIACLTNVNFYTIKGSEIGTKFVNESSNNLKAKFSKIRDSLPKHGIGIIFIDEIDQLGSKRTIDFDIGSKEDNKMLTTLLQEIQGFEQENKQLIILGATNNLDAIDTALTSRLKPIIMKLPSLAERKIAIANQVKKILGVTFDDNLSLWIAQQTEGFSYRDLETMLRTFARKALLQQNQPRFDAMNLLEQCIKEAHKAIHNDSEHAIEKYRDSMYN